MIYALDLRQGLVRVSFFVSRCTRECKREIRTVHASLAVAVSPSARAVGAGMAHKARDVARADTVALSRYGAVTGLSSVGEARNSPTFLFNFDLEAAGTAAAAWRNGFLHAACRAGGFTAADYANAFSGAPPDEVLVPRLLHNFLRRVDAKVGALGRSASRMGTAHVYSNGILSGVCLMGVRFV